MTNLNGNNKNSISVVIPIKDEIQSLVICLRSIFDQRIFPEEIFVVGKKIDLDLTKKSLNKSEQKKINFVQSTGDKNDARNDGINKSKSNYILYLDHDMRMSRGLIGDLKSKSLKYDALVIPEKGLGGNFFAKVKKFERSMIVFDSATTTPRFYRKDIFKKNEPFSSRFGLLDEWGFGQKLKSKNASFSTSFAFLYVDEGKLSLFENINRKYSRGLWMKKFLDIDRKEALRRTNPVSRGTKFYLKKFDKLFEEPALFTSLLLLKAIDLSAFFVGFLVGIIFPPKNFQLTDSEQQFFEVHDKLGKKYLQNMFLRTKWARYVDIVEKQMVDEMFGLSKAKSSKEKILDMGVGPGRWSSHFVEMGFEKVVGLDISKEMISVSKKHVDSNRYEGKVGNIDNLPFEDSSFEKLMCFRTFKYSKRPGEALKEARRVMKKGGLYLLEISNLSVQNRLLKMMSKIYLSIFPGTKVESKLRYFSKGSFYTKEEIINMAKKAKLINVESKYLFMFPSVSFPEKFDRLLFPLTKKIDSLLMKILPHNLFARSIVVLFKK